MDTAAYLTSQGWAGHGHALHHSGRGIIKPIAVAQKNNVLGVGKKKHDTHADQWWARAFDETLKGINATKDGATGTTEGLVVTGAAKQAGSKMHSGAHSVGHGLYSCFVKGDGLGGTLDEQNPNIGGKKGEDDAKAEETSRKLEDRLVHSLRKDEANKRKKKRRPAQSSGNEVLAIRRDRKEEGRDEDNGQAVNAARREKKEKRKERKDIDTTNEGQELPKAEPTEQRQRKRRKKARKERED